MSDLSSQLRPVGMDNNPAHFDWFDALTGEPTERTMGGQFVVVSEHGEEYINDPMVPVVLFFDERTEARGLVAAILRAARAAGLSVSMVAPSADDMGGGWLIHEHPRQGFTRTLCVQLDPWFDEVKYHRRRAREIRAEIR